MADRLEDWVALLFLPGVGPVGLGRALKRFQDPGLVAHRLSEAAWASLPGVRRDRLASLPEARKGLARRARREVALARRLGVRILTLEDEDYPAELREIPDPPPALYLKGAWRPGRPRVALVGARRCSHYGRSAAGAMARGLGGAGVEIVSGGARGIDTAAHEGALDAGAPTVAVLGSGLAEPYPPDNRDLFERIVERGGALLSEFPLEAAPRPEFFPRRNRVISGLSAAVVVVEAAERSGALITAGLALEQGREVMAVPGPVHAKLSQGPHRLIREGARLVRGAEDVLDDLPPMFRNAAHLPERAEPAPPPPLSEDEAAVAACLDDGEPVHVDDLALRAPLTLARLQAALFTLELKGAVEALPGRFYVRRMREG